eukprot:2158468-Ditylum_brightwellii.AAC.1
MQKANGECAKTDEESAEVFAEHFCKVFNNPDPPPCNDTVLPSVPTRPKFPHLGDLPSPAKVCSAIMRMGNGKAPGPSEILHLFWEGNVDIKAWHKGTLSPVPKPGDLADPNKWRPVCLLKTLYK